MVRAAPSDPGGVDAFEERVEAAALRVRIEGERAGRIDLIAATGEKLDRTRQRARPVERALRAALHLDPSEAVAGQVREVERTGESLVDRHAVDEHLRVLAFQPADENAGELARRAGLRHGEAGHVAQGVGHALGLALGEFLGGDHGNVGRRLVLRHRQPRGRDDDGSLRVGSLRGRNWSARAGRNRRGGRERAAGPMANRRSAPSAGTRRRGRNRPGRRFFMNGNGISD